MGWWKMAQRVGAWQYSATSVHQRSLLQASSPLSWTSAMGEAEPTPYRLGKDMLLPPQDRCYWQWHLPVWWITDLQAPPLKSRADRTRWGYSRVDNRNGHPRVKAKVESNDWWWILKLNKNWMYSSRRQARYFPYCSAAWSKVCMTNNCPLLI